MTKSRRSHIDWSRLTAWQVTRLDSAFVLKVAETAVATYAAETKRDRNVSFAAHMTANNRLIGYTLVARPAGRGGPDVAVGTHYLGCFYSGLDDLQDRDGRTIDIMYHDQYVRLLSFGTKPAARDYLLVLRNRSG